MESVAVEITKDEFELLRPYEYQLRSSQFSNVPRDIEKFVWEVARDRKTLDDYEITNDYYLEVAVC